MKKPLIITIGILLIVIVLAIWTYILIFGTPESVDDVFTDLGFREQTVTTSNTSSTPNTDAEQPANLSRFSDLNQLTQDPVAGFTVLDEGRRIRYAERGTGHIYEIDLASATTNRISQTTEPRTTEAHFGADGTYVALVSENGYEVTTFAGKLVENEAGVANIVGENLPLGATSVRFSGTSSLHYLTKRNGGSTIYSYDIEGQGTRVVAEIPMRDVLLTPSTDNSLYLFTPPSALYRSALYEIISGTLTPITPSEFALTPLVGNTYVVTGYSNDGTLASKAYLLSDEDDVTDVALPTIPEKCSFVSQSPDTLFCGQRLDVLPSSHIEAWYRGEEQSNDSLWEIDLTTGDAHFVIDLFERSGRVIDVTHMRANEDGTRLFFINKVDGALWYYDTTFQN